MRLQERLKRKAAEEHLATTHFETQNLFQRQAAELVRDFTNDCQKLFMISTG